MNKNKKRVAEAGKKSKGRHHADAKAKNNGKNKSTIGLILGSVLSVLLLCLAVYLINPEWFHFHKEQENGQEDEYGEELTVPTKKPVENEEVVPEATPIPEEVLYFVPMGEDVMYLLYADGTLKVSGTGKTRDFTSMTEFTSYFMKETGANNLPDLRNKWFHAVKHIVIEDGITELGDFALAMYTYAESVICNTSLAAIGENSFRGCGLNVEGGAKWQMDFSNTKVADGAFNVCFYPPVECPKTYLPEELAAMEAEKQAEESIQESEDVHTEGINAGEAHAHDAKEGEEVPDDETTD